MNISAVTYGGHLLTNFSPPKAHYTYAGVSIEFRGATRTADGYKPAGITLDMSAADAMLVISELLDAVQKHAAYDASLVPNFAKRLNKKLEKRR